MRLPLKLSAVNLSPVLGVRAGPVNPASHDDLHLGEPGDLARPLLMDRLGTYGSLPSWWWPLISLVLRAVVLGVIVLAIGWVEDLAAR